MPTPVAPAHLPQIELLPLKAGLPAGQAYHITVLARITPPAPELRAGARAPINLSLVLDRSGSMSGHPLEMARQAAKTAIRALQPQDRLSVVIFDNTVEMLIAPQLVTDSEVLCRTVEGIAAGGMTALHAGWVEGATLTAQHLNPEALNRVLLLSDGQANVGETQPDRIAQHVRGLTQRGVSTSTVGLGRDYQEDLLRAMADAGDGNFEHIEDAEALPAFFAAELQGFSRTVGHTVSLGLEPNPALQVSRVEVINTLTRNEFGRYQLPNLIAERPLEVVFTLQVPAQGQAAEVGVTRIRLAWTGRDGVRRSQRVQLTLPVLSADAYAALPEHRAVRLAEQLLHNARAKEDAVHLLDAGNVLGAQHALNSRRVAFAEYASSMPAPVAQQEAHALNDLAANADIDQTLTRKRALSQSYNRSRSKE
ncbi:VWA domain-containing protein [Deinococcus sp. Arct2-2]|uniref:vWA domain-containing protein n=1 Tax=Deinococcus sp. Arct2-2 TaxID=2568653 RepID=UPI0010A36912|nr:VWA domain-containing protein [Deinococcus sp. Arct2-2]THF71460.1 VWA domain-containing protein [Deinococcus sp. Arct2-2]